MGDMCGRIGSPYLLEGIPLAAHELQPVRRIGHDRIHRRIGQGPQHVETVAVVQRDPVALIVNGHVVLGSGRWMTRA